MLIALALFPVWQNFWFWFILRLIVGIGDNALNFASQTWITEFSPANKRGRNIAIYGLFFGLGFAVAPLMVPLVHVSESLPFILTSIISFIGWLFLFLLHNELPEQDLEMTSFRETFHRFANVWRYAWVAFLPPFAYGFLETSLNASFPVYALRIGMDLTSVSTLLVAFSIGTIAFQLPLGMIGDKIGRNKTITGALFIGFVCFTFAGMLDGNYFGSLTFIFIAGMFVGSMFSLGISYMADLTPKKLLPTGNILCGIFFSFGSLIGPSLGGLFIQVFPSVSFFYLLSGLFLVILLVTFKRNLITPTLK
ncbi:MFS transporter [Gracilibacillus halotolerans]